MTSQRTMRTYLGAVVCTAGLLVISACDARDPEHGSPAQGTMPTQLTLSDIALPPALVIMPPEIVPIDPEWPRRVANVVGFAPPNITEDYTAEFMSKPTSRAVGETLFVVRRSRNWVRIDEHFEGRIGSRFINLATETVMSADGTALSEQPPYLQVEPLIEEPWAGEARLISLRRAQLKDTDVRPPARLFSLDTWTNRIAQGLPAPSYTAVLAGEGGPGRVTIERRRGGLRAREEVRNNQRRLTVDDDLRGFHFDATYTLDGRLKRLSMNTGSRSRPQAYPRSDQPAERVLGETCRWVDAAAASDLVWERCLADDGAPLIEVSGGRGVSTRLDAVNVDRSPLPLQAVLPPPTALSSLRP